MPPVLVGADQDIVTPPVPASIDVVAAPIVEGVVAARMVAGAEKSPQPHLFFAITLNEYVAPAVTPSVWVKVDPE
jgi:hypothetical protein